MNEKPVKSGSKLLAAPKGVAASESSPERRRACGLASLYTIEEIHCRAETVTPLLSKIAAFESRPH